MATQADIREFLATHFPQSKCIVEAADTESATVLWPVGDEALRPGGTVSGPVLMAVADIALYVAVLARIGIVPLAVTTSLNINFLRKPAAGRNIVGVAKLLKVGKTLAIGEVSLYSQGSDDLVAHAVGTFSIPSARPGIPAEAPV